jgi:nucleoside-diphosphate-sugar epimerase
LAGYLVTGGGGFIGSNLAEALLRDGQDVRVLDNFSTGRRSNLGEAAGWARAGGARFELVEGDIQDAETCRRAVSGMDYVLHQAAIPSVQRSVKDPVVTNAVNVAGTLNLLAASRDAGVKRFVFASSSSLYGESPTLPKVETMPPAPISPYGLQKLAGETYCALFHRLYGTPTVALRYFNVFGPRQDPASEYSAVIPRFIAALRDGGRPTVFGDGEQTRDFTFVANVVQANRRACAASAEALGLAYNVACEERISLNGLLGVLAELTGKRADPLYAEARPGDIRHSLADIGRARTLLGYAPEIMLREGLRRTVESLE